MYCKNCGAEINEYAVACMSCGFAKNSGEKFCANCGSEINPGAIEYDWDSHTEEEINIAVERMYWEEEL